MSAYGCLWLIGALGAWFGIPFGLPLRNNPFHKGIPKESKPPGPKPPSQTFGCESWWFHSCDLSLVLTLHQKVQQGICVDNRFSEVGHHANEVGVPLVCNLGERPDAKSKPSHIVWEVLGQAASHIEKKRESLYPYICIMLILNFSLGFKTNKPSIRNPPISCPDTLNRRPSGLCGTCVFGGKKIGIRGMCF